jgi:hypothetical protein
MAPPRQCYRSSYARYERYRAQSGHPHAPLDRKSHRTVDGPDVSHQCYNRPLNPIHRLRLRHSRPEHFFDDTGTVSHFPPPLPYHL